MKKSLDLRTKFHEKNFFIYNQGCSPFARKNRKLQLEIQMVHAMPFGKLQKTWAVIFGGLFSHDVQFHSFMFMRKISTQVVCASGHTVVYFLNSILDLEEMPGIYSWYDNLIHVFLWLLSPHVNWRIKQI